MKVYEIFETVEITPSATLGADGKPAGFNVIDTDNNRTIRTFPDEGSAEEFRDQERARRTPAQSPDDSNNRNNSNNGNNARRRGTMSKDDVMKLLRRFGGGSNWVFAFINIIGLSQATLQSISDYKTLLTDKNCNRSESSVALARNTVGIRVTGAIATTVAGLAGGIAALKFLKTIATILAAVPGAGWVGAAIAMGSSWVISYIVERVITKPEVQSFIGHYTGNVLTAAIDRSCGVAESIDEDANTVFESMKSDATAEIKKSFADIVKDPRGKQEIIKVRNAIKSKAS
jgi:hypothetical protein